MRAALLVLFSAILRAVECLTLARAEPSASRGFVPCCLTSSSFLSTAPPQPYLYFHRDLNFPILPNQDSLTEPSCWTLLLETLKLWVHP